LGPLEDFLTARWGLHNHRGLYLPNHHPPWTLYTAELTTLDADAIFTSVGLAAPGRPPDHAAFSPGVPALFGLPVAS
jgi:uncharacterized protein YqjF (DUF2071 family)